MPSGRVISPGDHPKGNMQMAPLLSRDNVLAQFFIIPVMGPGELKIMSWTANLSIIVG
jgi:hypothetical protein